MNNLFILSAVAMGALDVDELSYQDQKMIFHGNIAWEHPLGSLSAKGGEAEFAKDFTALPETISLKEDVNLVLHGKGTLSCPFAFINDRDKKIFFYGNSDQKVIFTREDQSVLKGLKVELQFEPLSKVWALQKMTLLGDVEVVSQDSSLSGDEAFLEGYEKGRFNDIKLISHLGHTCQLNLNGLKLKTSRMELDENQGEVHLHGPVEMEQGASRIVASEDVIVKKALGNIHTEGNSSLTFIDKQGKQHLLKTHGTVDIDHEQGVVHLTSPLGGEQVHFQDEYGEIFADDVTLKYQRQSEKGSFEPAKLFLKGNVKLVHRARALGQYALADSAQFNFATNELLLKADSKKRVLFYDQLNKIQASAPSLTIRRDLETQKELIQGRGDVRFTFVEEELNELKKRFSLDDKQ